uniref:Uncharacterized protein n=1 Tax=Arundo donax TaxID=35708 RepID=A0A0A9A574_ARUDO
MKAHASEETNQQNTFVSNYISYIIK